MGYRVFTILDMAALMVVILPVNDEAGEVFVLKNR
jgi:hypothetical protein